MEQMPVPPPSGPVPLAICAVCGWKQLDPAIKPIAAGDRMWFIGKWRYDFTDCDDVARAKAEGLPGTQPPEGLS
jgi:hypothetical protein